jgi:hypothetical protein
MQLLGIPLRKPSFNEVTAATVMGVGLWLALVAVLLVSGHGLSKMEAGAALLVVLWGCLGVRFGIRIDHGSRHLLANLAVSAGLLAAYQGAWAYMA